MRVEGDDMHRRRQPCVYILASGKNGALYTGVTSDLIKRIWQHKNGYFDGFAKDRCIHNLVYYEIHETMNSAILREKQIKRWKRNWRIRLIEKTNPSWLDLAEEIIS